jgi:putative endonuclease
MSGWLNRLFGSAGEKAAIRYLKQQGFRIVTRNYENRAGEIDVIALDGQTIVFVEIKTRRNDSKGHPLDADNH